MRISIIGSGYVGLVSGVCLAEHGHDVVCVDVNRELVDRINRAEPPLYERGLAELLERNVPHRLSASTDLRRAILETDVSMIAVGTPFKGSTIDLGYVEEAARQIGSTLSKKDSYHTVVVKSTVVPGTTDMVVGPILEKASGKVGGRDFGLGMNPEFLREGEAVEDFMDPDRIVLGGIDDRTLSTMDALYASFGCSSVIRTTNRTAEMIKYAANAVFATMISFSNEIANLCAELGEIDIVEVMEGVHLDKRLSPIDPDGRRIRPDFTSYLMAGCGFGGSCFPKDVRALVAHGRENGVETSLLEAVLEVNERQPAQVMTLLGKHFPSLRGTRVGVLGLSFKPGTDDIRDSPAFPVIRALVDQGAVVKAYDPAAATAECLAGLNVHACDSMAEAIDDVDALLLLTAWPEFARLPELLDGGRQPLVVDGRRMFEPTRFDRYEGIGRNSRPRSNAGRQVPANPVRSFG